MIYIFMISFKIDAEDKVNYYNIHKPERTCKDNDIICQDFLSMSCTYKYIFY